MFALSPFQSRFLALALLVVVMGLLFTAVEPLWKRYLTNAENIEQLQERVFRYARLAASSEITRQQLIQWEKDDQVARYALPVESPDLAAARLQERVKAIIKPAGGKLLSTLNLHPTDDGPFQRITVNVKMRGSIGAVRETFYSLESGIPLLFIDNVVLISQGARRSKRRGVPTNLESKLEVRFDLSGYLHSAEE